MLGVKFNWAENKPDYYVNLIINSFITFRCVIDTFNPTANQEVQKEDNESDVEIVEEVDHFSNRIVEWYSTFLRSLEHMYPQAFDEVIKRELNSKKKTSARRYNQLVKILGFKPAVCHKLGDTYLFENLNHVNPVLRVQAVKYLSKEFEVLKGESIEFLKESIVNRLNDDDPQVVTAALNMPLNYLRELLDDTDLKNIFVHIMSKMRKFKKWQHVIKKAIDKFCSLDALPVDQHTVLCLLPHIIPLGEKYVPLSIDIINSVWGKKFDLTRKVAAKINANSNMEDICRHIYQVLCVERSIDLDNLLDFNSVDKENTLMVISYLLIKSCTLKKASIEDVSSYLDAILELIENTQIVSTVTTDLTSNILSQVMKSGKRGDVMFPFVKYLFSTIIEDTAFNIPKPWCNISESPHAVLCKRLFEICVTGCSLGSYSSDYLVLLQNLLQKFCSNGRERLEFIANIACGHVLYLEDPKMAIDSELQLKSVKLFGLGIEDSADWIFESSVVVSMILFNLNNPDENIRKCTVDLVERILKIGNNKGIYMQLLRKIYEHKEELLLDHEQIQQVLNTILSHSENKMFKKECLSKLTGIITDNCPVHVSAELLRLLSQYNNANTFSTLISVTKSIQTSLKCNEYNPKFILNIYESNILRLLIDRINENTASSFDKDSIWSFVVFCMTQYNQVILDEEQLTTSPTILLIKKINEAVFKNISSIRCKELVKLICAAGSLGNDPSIASVASKTMKKIHLDLEHFKPILEDMLNATDPESNTPKKKKSTVTMFSYHLSETNEWKLGVTLLEYVQNKKKMSVDNKFVTLLFQILSKCLRFEEQSYVEYTKQLILSSLWYYCKKFVDDNDLDEVNYLKAAFNVELIVQSIRGTQNPQTHHHALMLLSHAAYMLPEQVLHHTMEIFTFMGSSVLRHDDAYSFQIITKIIETLIPILVKMDRSVENYNERELKKLHGRVIPVLRIFADVVLHVPEHRRLPLYKKLIETLGSSEFLWSFLALLLETHVAHWNDAKDKSKRSNKNLMDQVSPINRLDFGQSILLEFPPEVVLENFNKIMNYIKSLPIQKDDSLMDVDVDSSEIFNISGHTSVQLRHYKYSLITFMNTCLSSPLLIQHTTTAMEPATMEKNYKAFIISILTFIQNISNINDDKTAKYWRVMLHHSYDLLDHTNNLLAAPMFVSVIRGLLRYTLQTVRRKSMELLNTKIQFSPEFFADCENQSMYSLLPPLLDMIKTIEGNDDINETAQEMELNQQTALLSLKLLIRHLAPNDPEPFKPVLERITEYTCNPNISGNVMASVVLCLAELCSNLKAHALTSLRKFMPALIKVLKKQRKAETPELILLSTVTAISKIVESLPLFLSPYLQKILVEYSILLAKWQSGDQDEAKVSAIVSKLNNIKRKVAGSIPPRVLIPVVNQTHQMLLEKENFDAIGPLMSVLAESFTNVTTADFTSLQQDLTAFFLSALQLRSDAVEKGVDMDIVDRAEDEVVNALVCLVLKLSETSFRPFYFKIYDWAIRTNVEGHKDRAITFYR